MSFFVMIVLPRFAMFMVVVVVVVAYHRSGCSSRPLAVLTSDGLPGLLPSWGLVAHGLSAGGWRLSSMSLATNDFVDRRPEARPPRVESCVYAFPVFKHEIE